MGDVVLRVAYRDGCGEPDYLTSLDRAGCFLRTSRPFEVGQVIAATLSFPHLLAPIDVTCVVRELSGPDDRSPDVPAGAHVAFVFAGDGERAAFDAWLAQLHDHATRPPRAAPFRVLLVEDNRFAHKIFNHAVERARTAGSGALEIHGAGDIAQALEILRAMPIDLALIDYFLPSAVGTDLIRAIRSEPRWAHLPALVISVGGDGVRGQALAAGADLYLDKPVLLKHLLNTLYALVGTPP